MRNKLSIFPVFWYASANVKSPSSCLRRLLRRSWSVRICSTPLLLILLLLLLVLMLLLSLLLRTLEPPGRSIISLATMSGRDSVVNSEGSKTDKDDALKKPVNSVLLLVAAKAATIAPTSHPASTLGSKLSSNRAFTTPK
jgi:hypothetical protein